MIFAVAHPSLAPSIIAAISATMAAIVAAYANNSASKAKAQALQNQIDQIEQTERIVRAIMGASDRQQDRFEQFIRDYFRLGGGGGIDHPKRRHTDLDMG